MSLYFKTRPAFTLVEMLISISIIGILSAIIFTSFNNNKQRNAVKYAADQLAIDVQAAQNYAQTGIVPSGTSEPPKKYGISFNLTGIGAISTYSKYSIYGEYADPENGYTTPPGTPPDDPPDVVVKTVTLPNNVRIRGIRDSSNRSTTTLDIYFSSSSLPVTFLPATGFSFSANSSYARIILKHMDINTCYSVDINRITGIVTKRQLNTADCI